MKTSCVWRRQLSSPMEQSSVWDTKRNRTGQKFFRFLYYPKGQYRVRMNPPKVSVKLQDFSPHSRTPFLKKSVFIWSCTPIFQSVYFPLFLRWIFRVYFWSNSVTGTGSGRRGNRIITSRWLYSHFYMDVDFESCVSVYIYIYIYIYIYVSVSGREHNLHPGITVILKIFPSVFDNSWL